MFSCSDFFFFFKQKTAYEITASDWSSDVCSSDLRRSRAVGALSSGGPHDQRCEQRSHDGTATAGRHTIGRTLRGRADPARLSFLPEPLETVRELRTSLTLVRELGD